MVVGDQVAQTQSGDANDCWNPGCAGLAPFLLV